MSSFKELAKTKLGRVKILSVPLISTSPVIREIILALVEELDRREPVGPESHLRKEFSKNNLGEK